MKHIAFLILLFISCQLAIANQAATWYNLGNASFKQDRLAEAYCYYQRALQLSPRDADIAFNLEFTARQLNINNEDAAVSEMWVALNPANYLSEPELKWLVITLFSFLNLLIYMVIRYKNNEFLKNLLYILLVLSIVSTGLWYLKLYQLNHKSTALVITPSAQALSGPAPNLPSLFVVNQGQIVKIIRSKNDWLEAKLANDLTGWIKAQHLCLY